MKNVIVIGLGEIGSTIYTILKKTPDFRVYGFDSDENKMRELDALKPPGLSTDNIDVLHVCIPASEKNKFIDIIKFYIKKYQPKLTIINSTVPIGTTIGLYNQCGGLIAHSPCRGVHKNKEYMLNEFLRWVKYVGGATPEAGQAASEHFVSAGLKTKILISCSDTEFAKLFETTYRTWMIVFFQKMSRLAEIYCSFNSNVKINFDEATDFIEDTHRVRNDRPIMFPDVIGGHCLLPNSKLLLEDFEPEMLKLILDSNQKRRTEMANPDIADETKKIFQRVTKYEEEQDKKVMRTHP